jgi:PhnB protein
MPVNPIPPGYQTVTPYLTVANARKQIEFLKQAFGAITTESLHEDSDGSIRHAELKIGSSMIMLGQGRDQWKPNPAGFYLYVPDCDETYKRAMRAGAKSLMEPADQFYGDRNAGVEDEAGNQWWIATHVEDVSHEEMQRRMNASLATQSK